MEHARDARRLRENACLACHSNLTDWPWYTNVAPVSWLTQHDVEDGRAKLNFSEWQRPQEADLQEVVERSAARRCRRCSIGPSTPRRG